MSRVLVFGATSAIAQHAIRRFAADGASLFLVGRRESLLTDIAADARVRGATMATFRAIDLDDCAAHTRIVEEAHAALGAFDAVIVAHGTLPDQTQAEQSWDVTEACLHTNFLSAASIAHATAPVLAAQRGGALVVISSVAADRARPKNWIYGTAKGALSMFLDGLRMKLHAAGVRVVTIKPGMVDTPMTAHLKKGLLFARAEAVGARVYRAALTGRGIIYTPSYWRLIMAVIRMLPEAVLRRLPI